ncbi:Uncharacterised protein [uncultured archaeon]|nr:Uncharacterised protein [uncultured archaeon]
MNWQNIMEGTLASLLATGVTSLVGFLIYKTGKKSTLLKDPNKTGFEFSNFTPFSFGVIVTSFFVVLSGFSFYFQWENMPYLVTIAILVWMGTIWIYNDQCPKCKKIFKKEHVRREIISEERIPHTYYDKILYLYTDGNVKDTQSGKKKKTWTEIVRVVKDHFSCRGCGHNWNSSIKRITVNESDRPKPIRIKTNYKNPAYDF